tara:strand:+ start:2838 stop:3335 length:498 start_codon:yes stop_codon:yes gene_type:complete
MTSNTTKSLDNFDEIEELILTSEKYRKTLQGTNIAIDVEEAYKDEPYSTIINVAETLNLLEDISFSVATGLPLGLLVYDPRIELPDGKLKFPFAKKDRFNFLDKKDKETLIEINGEGLFLKFYEGERITLLEEALTTKHFKKIDIDKYLPHSITKELEPILKPVH